MRHMIFTAGLVTGLFALAPAASAASCWDLWYERNAIYDDNGFCFSSNLGKRTFDNSDCWTKTPQLSQWEQRRVAEIKAEERRRGCKVN
ncbi:YARHG domain-containing protein [Hoeflea sp.]|uniref:YARHG domain-containing protein n=1 Tax=Hoeflea sp. TaxID=1940281 RepID=UPI0019B42379|nr:YARHG domain-containing protein [Hoeflea sp.]MBC7283769.1 YARHG domain-containing protein [Hoeflea sp.]